MKHTTQTSKLSAPAIHITDPSRREFLRAASAYSALGAAAPLAMSLSCIGEASAATATDYKALVCLFMFGGNDSFNTLIANDPTSWTQYQRWRNQGAVPLALPAVGQPGGVLSISPVTPKPGRSFALHPRLTNLAAMFNAPTDKRVSWISNVGPVLGPLDVSNYATGVAPFIPPALFSHNDQQSIWQSGVGEGSSVGWGGRIGDLLASRNGAQSIFTTVTSTGTSVFLAGENVLQYAASRNVGSEIRAVKEGSYGANTGAILQRVMSRDSNHLFEKEIAAVHRRSFVASSALKSAALPSGAGGVALPSLVYSPFAGGDVENPLAIQLQTVARIIGGSQTLGLKRQVFLVGIGGFDSHAAQMPDHDYNMKLLDHAMGYFDGALSTLDGQDVRDRVTLFSASDFGRTFSSNGDGTDHGWGAHHFIYGGAVKGGEVFGEVPPSGIGHAWDFEKGILLPTTSVEQYGGTLARWMGVTASNLVDVFPNVGRFSNTDLAFFR